MIERSFLGWDVPLLTVVILFLTDRYLTGSAIDLRGVTLVVPGGRAGRRLKELLVDAAAAAGSRLSPPRVTTLGALPGILYEEQGALAGDLLARQVWSAALAESPAEARTVFGVSPDPEDLSGWTRLGRQIADLHGELIGEGLAFEDVVKACRSSDLLFDDGERWRCLAAVQRRYHELLGSVGYLDPGRSRREAARGPGRILEGRVYLIGIVEIPAVVATMIANHAASFTALVHAPLCEAAGFDAFGRVSPPHWQRRTIRFPPDVVRIVDRPTDQGAAVVSDLSTLSPDRIADAVVAVPDEDLLAPVQEWFESAGVPTHYAGGRPAPRYGPYALLGAVAAYLGRGGWDEFAALVRHPDLERAIRRTGRGHPPPPRIEELDEAFQKTLPASVGGATAGGAGFAPIARMGRLLETGQYLGRLRGRRALNEWPTPILEFLAEVYGGRPLNANVPADSRLLRLLETFRDGCLDIASLPAPFSPRVPAADAIRLLLDHVSKATVADEGEPTAVELLGWLELAADDSPLAYVVGFDDAAIPGTAASDTFLPDRLRAILGLPDAQRRYARDAYLLEALLASRERVRLVSGRIDGAGDPLRPSRLMLTDRGAALASRVSALYTSPPDGGSVPPPLTRLAGTRSAFALPPETALPVHVPNPMPVTAFARFLADPYVFALERELRLRGMDDEAREMDGGMFGGIAHDCLAAFGRSDLVDSTDAEAIGAFLGQVLDERVARAIGGRSFPAVAVQVEQLRFRLGEFARWQAHRAGEGWRILVVEGQLPGVEATGGLTADLDVDGEPVRLVGRIDRIDFHPETGRYAVLDYKTSDSARTPEEAHLKNGAWVDLQLPLYRLLFREARDAEGRRRFPPDSPLALGYVLLPRDRERTGLEIAEWSDAELESAYDTAREVVRALRLGRVQFDRDRLRLPSTNELAPLLGLRLLMASDAEDAPEHSP